MVQKAFSFKHFVEQKGTGLPYREELLTELSAQIDGTERAASAASATRVELQDKQREVRELSATFHRALISLRRAVRGTLGSKHFDYQRLRMPKAAATAEPLSDEAPVTAPSATGGEPTSNG